MKRLTLLLCTTLLFVGSALFFFNLPPASHAAGVDTNTPTATATNTLGPCDVVPHAPILKQPAQGAVFTTQSILLKWHKLPCNPIYRLEIRSNSRHGDLVVLKTFKKKAITLNLELGRKYAWNVRVCVAENCYNSEWRKFDLNIPTRTPTLTPTRTRTPAPPKNSPTATPTRTITPVRACESAYPTVCIPPPPPILTCAEIPYRNFPVLPPDPYGFDPDHDGIGCES